MRVVTKNHFACGDKECGKFGFYGGGHHDKLDDLRYGQYGSLVRKMLMPVWLRDLKLLRKGIGVGCKDHVACPIGDAGILMRHGIVQELLDAFECLLGGVAGSQGN